MPERPWQRVATDLCDHDGKRYLVVSDYYSPWLEVLRMRGTASEQVVLGLKSVFVRFRTPDILVSDNGTHSTTVEFMDLCKQRDIEHVTFSLHNPQGNGHAERAVQEAKKILKRTLKPKWQNMKEVKKRNNVKKREQARYFDRRQVAMDLPRISLGDEVLVRTDNEKPWKWPAMVVGPSITQRSWDVEQEEGSEKRRNRKHLQLLPLLNALK